MLTEVHYNSRKLLTGREVRRRATEPEECIIRVHICIILYYNYGRVNEIRKKNSSKSVTGEIEAEKFSQCVYVRVWVGGKGIDSYIEEERKR